MNPIRLFLIGLVTIIVMLLLIQLTAQGNLVTEGTEYDHIENRIAEVKRENILLREQVYHYASLTIIEKEASASGFVKMGEPIYVIR